MSRGQLNTHSSFYAIRDHDWTRNKKFSTEVVALNGDVCYQKI